MSSRRSRSGGSCTGNDVQAIEQILAEGALRDHLREIGVGRCDDANVDLDCVRIADALELAFLQHTQHLRLQRRAHGPDLVEEERALVRLFEAALTVADRTGERAAHVTEQFGFEQRFRNGAAVDRHEPVGAPRAGMVNRSRGEFLARARSRR